MAKKTRSHRFETDADPAAAHTTEDGITVMISPSSKTVSVHEALCEKCGHWYEVRGVHGALKRMAEGCPHCGAAA